MKKLFFSILIFLSFSMESESAILVPPDLKWFTIETQHFYIHYHNGLEKIAEESAGLFEEVDGLMRNFIPDMHEGKTHVVMTYFTDLSNGFATPFPQRTIYLFLTPPSSDSELVYNMDWVKTLFIHEYSHIVQLERAGGFPEILRKIFGRVYFPNILLPYFFIEGYATFNETRFSGFGRFKSSYYEMFLRTAFLTDSVDDLENFSISYPVHWPFGMTPYLYGSSFLGYIAETYGEECLEKFNIKYSSNIIPFLINYSMESACGKTVKELYEEWKREMKARYEAVKAGVYSEGVVEGRRITRLGRLTRGVRFYSDDELVFTHYGMDEYPAINLLSLSTGKIKKLFRINYNYLLSVFEKHIYFSDTEFRKGYWIINDIYVVKDGKRKRLTKGLRAFSPEATPWGVWFIERTPEGSALCIIEDGKKGECPYRTEGFILSFRFDRSYSRIVLSEQRVDGRTDIVLFDIASGEKKFLTSDKAVDLFPVFSPDGMYVIFSSDRNGIPNLYAKNIQTSEEYMITNLLGGAFESDISPDGDYIVYTGYTKDGFDLFIMRYEPSAWRKVVHEEEVGLPKGKKVVEFEKKNYIGFKYFYPRFWLPWVWYSSEGGFFTQIKTGGADPLFKHIYMLDLYYQWKRAKPGGSLLYLEESLYPSLIFNIAELPERVIVYSNKNFRKVFWIQKTLASFSIAVPVFRKMRWSLYGGGGYIFYRERTKKEYEEFSNERTIGNLSGLNAFIYFDSTKYYPASFSEEEGFRIFGEAIKFHPSFGSDHSAEEFLAFGEWYEEISNIVFHIRGDYGKYSGAKEPDLILTTGSSGDIPVKGIKGFFASDVWTLKGEMRFPLLIERGISTLPFAFRYIYYSPFVHGLIAKEISPENFKEKKKYYKDLSIGIEGNFEIYIGYNIPLVLRIGFARGIRDKGESDFYLYILSPIAFPLSHPLLKKDIPYLNGYGGGLPD